MSQTPEKQREKTPYSQNSPYRNSYSIEKKLQVIKDHFEKYDGNASESSRQTNIHRSMISRWLQDIFERIY